MNVEHERFEHAIRGAARRKSRALRATGRTAWSGLGTFGAIGWSVATPTLLGTLLGNWLDRRHPGVHSWTLALLVAGLVLGCANAWHWIAGQARVLERASSGDE